jgi:hypothetical protein
VLIGTLSKNKFALSLLYRADTTKDAWHGSASFLVSDNETLSYHYERNASSDKHGYLFDKTQLPNVGRNYCLYPQHQKNTIA